MEGSDEHQEEYDLEDFTVVPAQGNLYLDYSWVEVLHKTLQDYAGEGAGHQEDYLVQTEIQWERYCRANNLPHAQLGDWIRVRVGGQQGDRQISEDTEWAHRVEQTGPRPGDDPHDALEYSGAMKRRHRGINWSVRITASQLTCKAVVKRLQAEGNTWLSAFRGQIEQGCRTGSFHVQAVLRTTRQMDKTTLFKLLWDLFRGLDVAAGQISINAIVTAAHLKNLLAYVWKNATRVGDSKFSKGEYGEAMATTTTQARKQTALEMIKMHGESKAKYLWACANQSYKDFEEAANQHKWCLQAKEEHQLVREANELMQKLYPWQRYVVDIYHGPVDPRLIYVILDEQGNSGKTALQKAMAAKFRHNILTVTNGKTADLAYIANKAGMYKAVQMNVARMQVDLLNLGVIETLKDGLLTNTKYKGNMMEKRCPHAFIYTNSEPTWTNLTTDRWLIIHLGNGYTDGFKTYNWDEWQARKERLAEEAGTYSWC